MQQEHQLVFVGGLHRSGTTPLANAMAAHGEISGLTDTGVSENEGQHLQDVYHRIRAFGGMGRFANAPAAHLTEESDLVSRANADRLFEAWSPYWDLSRRVLLEKSPSNLIMGRFLQALFPGSPMVVVMRHPVVVALALQKWIPRFVSRNGRVHTTLTSLVAHWVRAHTILAQDAPHMQKLMVMRYEELVASPVQLLAPVQQTLQLSTPIPTDSFRGGQNERYAELWEAKRRGSLLERRTRKRIVEMLGPEIAMFGYDVEDLTVLSPMKDTSLERCRVGLVAPSEPRHLPRESQQEQS
jgi:hypothetical protein